LGESKGTPCAEKGVGEFYQWGVLTDCCPEVGERVFKKTLCKVGRGYLEGGHGGGTHDWGAWGKKKGFFLSPG